MHTCTHTHIYTCAHVHKNASKVWSRERLSFPGVPCWPHQTMDKLDVWLIHLGIPEFLPNELSSEGYLMEKALDPRRSLFFLGERCSCVLGGTYSVANSTPMLSLGTAFAPTSGAPFGIWYVERKSSLKKSVLESWAFPMIISTSETVALFHVNSGSWEWRLRTA